MNAAVKTESVSVVSDPAGAPWGQREKGGFVLCVVRPAPLSPLLRYVDLIRLLWLGFGEEKKKGKEKFITLKEKVSWVFSAARSRVREAWRV